MSLKEDDKGVRYNRAAPQVRKKLEEKYGSKIRISRKDWKIIYCTEIALDNIVVAGLCDPADNSIYVSVLEGNVEDTLLHEIFHAEIGSAGFRQRNDWCMNIEEQIVEILSECVNHSFRLRRRTRRP